MGSKKKSPKFAKQSAETRLRTGETLKHLRNENGLSREEVASELETTATTVYRWETGRSSIDIDNISALASVYKTDVANMFAATDDQIEAAQQIIGGTTQNDSSNQKEPETNESKENKK